MSLADFVGKKTAFITHTPIQASEGGGLYRAGRIGGGLSSVGGFAIPPSVIAALLPAVGELGKQAVPGVIKGAKKVGKFFKKLFGLGLLRSGGLRVPNYDPAASYHNLTIYKGSLGSDDMPIPDYRYDKYSKKFGKLKGGFDVSDVPRIMEMIGDNKDLAAKLIKVRKNPVKFINTIVKALKR